MGLREDLDHPWEEYWKDGTLTAGDRSYIITEFVPLARAIACRLKGGLPSHVLYDDLVSAGVVGLISAVDKFSLERGYHFRRYAAIRIKGAMLDELRQMDWAPRSLRRDNAQLTDMRRRLGEKLGRQPTVAEMAAHLEMDVDDFGQLVKRLTPKRMIFLNEMGSRQKGEDNGGGLAFVPDPNSPDPAQESETRDAYELLVKAVSLLKERQRQMLTLYYFDGLNLKEIAAIFDVTESRVSQIHTEGLSRLKLKVRNMM